MRQCRISSSIVALVSILLTSSAFATVRQVTHTPLPGQYSSVSAALSAAGTGDTIEIIDNSAPFVGYIYSGVTKNFILIRANASLNPRPTIRGVPGAATINPCGIGFRMENLIIEGGGAYYTIQSEYGPDTYVNCKIDGTGTVLAIHSEGPLSLINCEVIGGGTALQHVKGGPVVIDGCNIHGGTNRGLEFDGSGVYTIQNSTVTANAGNTIYTKDDNSLSGQPLEMNIINSVITTDSTGYQDLIVNDQGTAYLPHKLFVNQCDIIGGRNVPGPTGTALVCHPQMTSLAVQNTIFYNFTWGAYWFQNSAGLTGGIDCYCVYQDAPYDVNLFGIASGVASVQLGANDPLYVNPTISDYRLYAASQAANRNLNGVPQWCGTKGVRATREVTHTPQAGQYASVVAALAAAGNGEVIEIIDNSAPFAENVSVANKSNLIIQGKYGLDPMPTISGINSGTVMTHDQYSSNNYVRNLNLAGGSAEIVLDERFVYTTYQNAVIDGHKTTGANTTYTIRSQGALALLNCVVKNGRDSIENFYGDLYARQCSFYGADENGVCILGSGHVTLDCCDISSLGGMPLFIADSYGVGGAPVDIHMDYTHVGSDSLSGNGALVIVLDGGSGVKTALTIDHCDFTGAQDPGFSYTGIYALTRMNSLSVRNSIFYKLTFGAYYIADNTGLTGGIEDYCAYQRVVGNNDVANYGITAGIHDRIMQPYELAYTSPKFGDYSLIEESPLISASSTGLAIGSYGMDPRAARLPDFTHEWEVGTSAVLWNFQNCYNSCVVYHPADTAYPYKMWFFGNPTGPVNDKIYFARSASLTSGWQVYRGNGQYDTTMTPSTWVSVLPQGSGTAWDNAATGDPAVVLKDGVFYMAYSAVNFRTEGGQLHVTNSIMAATSTDGINWTRSTAPIIIWENEVADGPVGSSLPADYQGFYHRPSLIWMDTYWRCYFDYYRTVVGQAVGLGPMGYAECSVNGNFLTPANWTYLARDDNSLLVRWGNPNVKKVGNTFYSAADACWFNGLGGDGVKTCLATSLDGIFWNEQGMVQPNGGDCTDIPEQLVYSDPDGNGTWLYLFYAWRLQSPYGDPPNYKEIRWMRKLIR